MSRSKVLLLLPNNPNWRGGSRATILIDKLTSMGLQVQDTYIKGSQCPTAEQLSQYDVVFNHGLQAPTSILRRYLGTSTKTDVVLVNHSSIAHIETNASGRSDRFTESIHAIRALEHFWLGSVQPIPFAEMTGLDRAIFLPMPLPFRKPLKKKTKPSGKIRVVIGGRLDMVKNTMSTLLGLVPIMHHIELILCMPLNNYIKNFIHAFGMKARVPGRLSHERWLQLLNEEADIVIQNSLTESFNNVALEAMQLGVPTITSPAIKFSDSLLNVDPDCPDQISDRFFRILQSYDFYSERAIGLAEGILTINHKEYEKSVRTVLDSGRFWHPTPLPQPKTVTVVEGEKSRAIVMSVPTKHQQELYDVVGPHWKNYAKKVGASLILIKEQLVNSYPIGNKWLVGKIAPNYDRTLFIDNDVLPTPSAPDIFEHVPVGKFGIVDEEAWVNRDVIRQKLKDIADCNDIPLTSPRMLNAGVLVMDPSVCHMYRPPESTTPKTATLDQNWFTVLNQDQMDKVHILDPRFNFVRIRDDFEEQYHTAWFIHLAGMKPHRKRVDRLRELAEELCKKSPEA